MQLLVAQGDRVKFRPHQADNAIVRVSFVCEFAQPIGGERLKSFEALHSRHIAEFPKLDLTQGITIQVGPGGKPATIPGLAAVAFQDFGRDGQLLRTLQVQQAAIVFIHQRYTRWQKVWPQARMMLVAALEAVPHAQLQAFGLEYVDRFVLPASEGPPDMTSLFRRGTQFLVPRIFDISGPCHSHHGSLQDKEPTPCPHSKNENINVDLVSEKIPLEQFAVNMLSRHRRVLAQTVLASDSVSLLDVFMEEMHLADKTVMRDLLTEEAAREINLNGTDA